MCILGIELWYSGLAASALPTDLAGWPCFFNVKAMPTVYNLILDFLITLPFFYAAIFFFIVAYTV